MAMIHAENTDCIAWLTDQLLAAGHTAPKFHAASRPMLVEREATHRAIALSELVDIPVLIVHVSGREAVEQIRWAQGQGLRIYGETCPQYLFLTGEHLEVLDIEHLALPVASATVLKGRSGSGKTTLLNLVAGVSVPTAGTVNVGDTDIFALS